MYDYASKKSNKSLKLTNEIFFSCSNQKRSPTRLNLACISMQLGSSGVGLREDLAQEVFVSLEI